MDMEKIYLTMKRTGAGNIVLGILSIWNHADHHRCESVKEKEAFKFLNNIWMIKEHGIGIRFSMFLYFFTFDNNDIKYGKNRPWKCHMLKNQSIRKIPI